MSITFVKYAILGVVMLAGVSITGCGEDPQIDDARAYNVSSEPASYGAPDAAFINAIAVDSPTKSRPVRFGGVIAPATVEAGAAAILVIRCNTLEQWHINQVGRATELLIPTSLSLQLPAGIEAVDSWVTPAAKSVPGSDDPVYAGDFVFYHHLRIRPDAPRGVVTAHCQIEYQACDNLLCLPPASENIRIDVMIQ